jgi:hypothetical protein
MSSEAQGGLHERKYLARALERADDHASRMKQTSRRKETAIRERLRY